jgi:hypothetical protein
MSLKHVHFVGEETIDSATADSGDAVEDAGVTEVMGTVSPFRVAKGARVARQGERT